MTRWPLRRRRSTWERATRAVTDRVDGRTLLRSGVGAVGSLVTVTAASSAVSAIRRRSGSSGSGVDPGSDKS